MDPARMFRESLTSRPELENSQGHLQTFGEFKRMSALPPEADIRCDRATRLLEVGLDFRCERSVAVDAGDAVAAS
jgi:hypothetical protein